MASLVGTVKSNTSVQLLGLQESFIKLLFTKINELYVLKFSLFATKTLVIVKKCFLLINLIQKDIRIDHS